MIYAMLISGDSFLFSFVSFVQELHRLDMIIFLHIQVWYRASFIHLNVKFHTTDLGLPNLKSKDSDYEEVRPVPRLDREGPLRDAWGKLQHGGYLGRTRRDMDPTEAEMLAWTRQAEQRSAEE